jgi:hypothetical protein
MTSPRVTFTFPASSAGITVSSLQRCLCVLAVISGTLAYGQGTAAGVPPEFTTIFVLRAGHMPAGPMGPIVVAQNGALYGTGESSGFFELQPPASPGDTWTETTLLRPGGRFLFWPRFPPARPAPGLGPHTNAVGGAQANWTRRSVPNEHS